MCTTKPMRWDPYLLISKTLGLVIKQWYPVNCVATLWVLWSLVPLLQIRSEGLQCYTLMSTSHNRELTAKGGSAALLNFDTTKEIMMNMVILLSSWVFPVVLTMFYKRKRTEFFQKVLSLAQFIHSDFFILTQGRCGGNMKLRNWATVVAQNS